MVLTILVAILVVFFVGSAILEGIGSMFAVSSLVGVSLFKKIRRWLKHRKEREVTVFCPCSHSFLATPRFDNDWRVVCPRCNRTLRVDVSKRKKGKKKRV